MTLQQLFYIITVAETGSMNKAAEKLYISQPTLTSAIKELEQETNIVIFSRTNKGVIITESGAEFLMYAKQVYSQYEFLKEKYGPQGTIKRKFGVSTQHYSFAVKAFVEMVKDHDISSYEFAIRESRTLEVIEDVANSRSEIGILYLSNTNRKFIRKLLAEHNLQFTELTRCNACVYIHSQHPLASKKSISLADLQDYPCLSFDQGMNQPYYLAEEILSENQYNRTIKANDRATILNLMVGLNGYTLCPGIVCEELNGDSCVVIPYADDENNPNRVMEIGYITRKNTSLSNLGKQYIDEVKKYLG